MSLAFRILLSMLGDACAFVEGRSMELKGYSCVKGRTKVLSCRSSCFSGLSQFEKKDMTSKWAKVLRIPSERTRTATSPCFLHEQFRTKCKHSHLLRLRRLWIG